MYEAIPTLLMEKAKPENVPYMLGLRIFMSVLMTGLVVMIKIAWSRRKNRE